MDAETRERFRQLEQGCETLLALHSAHTAVITSLIVTHQNLEQMQLHLASVLEMMDSSQGPPLNDRQKQQMRDVVEGYQRLKPVAGRIDPLAKAGL